MFWRKRKRKTKLVRHHLRNGETVWLYPGEILIDRTKAREGMEKKFDIYINGAYMGRASGSVCKAIRDKEAEHPHKVHGAVLVDSDPPRVMLNPTHAESPALVRRVIEAMDGEAGSDIQKAAHAFEQAINSQPGIEVELACLETARICDAHTRNRYSITITQPSRERVYP